MELRYINGEKVYVEDFWHIGLLDSEWTNKDGTIQVVRHREIISTLNKLFERAEETPDKLPDDLVGFDGLIKAVINYKKEWRATVEFYNGPRNLDSVLSYTWEQKRGGPSG